MARLGHSTVNASLIYQQAVDGRAEEVAEALSALATGKVRELAEEVAETERKAGWVRFLRWWWDRDMTGSGVGWSAAIEEAAWIGPRLSAFGADRVDAVIPGGFAAYARLPHP